MQDGQKIRFARFEEFPELISMWKTCFNDTEQGAANIFMNLQKAENILVLTVSGKIAAMLSIREFKLTSPVSQCKAAYIYGIATLPGHRGKGYSTALISDAAKILKNRGFACSALVPADEGLFGFYRKRGFKTAFNINKASILADEISEGESFELALVEREKLAFIRDARFGDSKMFVCWDSEYLDYIAGESELYGGGALGFEKDGKQVYAICYRDGGTIYVKELAASCALLETALRSIKAHFEGAKQFVVYLREDVKTSYTNNLLPFGMVQWYDDNIQYEMERGEGMPAYIAHVLD